MSQAEDAWGDLEAEIVSCRRCPRLVAWREEVAQVKRRAYRGETYWGRPVPGFGDRAARVLIVGLAPGAHGANRTGRMFTGDSSGDFLYAALYRAGFANQPVSRGRDDGLILRDAFISAACRCAPPDNKPTAEELAACLPFLVQEVALLPDVRVVVALGRVAFEAVVRVYRSAAPASSAAPDLKTAPGGWKPRPPLRSRPSSAELVGVGRLCEGCCDLGRPAVSSAPASSAAPDLKIALDVSGTCGGSLAETTRSGGASGRAAPTFAHGAVVPLGPSLPVLIASYHPSRQNTQTGRLTVEMFDAVWAQVRGFLEERRSRVFSSL